MLPLLQIGLGETNVVPVTLTSSTRIPACMAIETKLIRLPLQVSTSPKDDLDMLCWLVGIIVGHVDPILRDVSQLTQH